MHSWPPGQGRAVASAGEGGAWRRQGRRPHLTWKRGAFRNAALSSDVFVATEPTFEQRTFPLAHWQLLHSSSQRPP